MSFKISSKNSELGDDRKIITIYFHLPPGFLPGCAAECKVDQRSPVRFYNSEMLPRIPAAPIFTNGIFGLVG